MHLIAQFRQRREHAERNLHQKPDSLTLYYDCIRVFSVSIPFKTDITIFLPAFSFSIISAFPEFLATRIL